MQKTIIPKTSSQVERIAFKGLKTLIDTAHQETRDGYLSDVFGFDTDEGSLRETLELFEEKLARQAPYFEGWLLDKVAKLKQAFLDLENL